MRNRVPKKSVRNIWRDLRGLLDSQTEWSEIKCDWEMEWYQYLAAGKWRSIEVSYDGLSRKFSVREDCELKSEEDKLARTLLLETYDKIVTWLSGVKRIRVPFNTLGRNLKRKLVQNKLPIDFEILIEDEARGLGKRYWVKDDRKVRSASYSTRETVRIKGIELPRTKMKSEKEAEKTSKETYET